MPDTTSPIKPGQGDLKNLGMLCTFWAVVFILYLPAAKAGRVGDFPGWVKNVSTMPFWDYVNRTESHIPSLYQFTQIVTWLFYQVFGAKAWPWHLLYVTLQAANGYLLFVFCSSLFSAAGIHKSAAFAYCGSMLFCICPHIVEVVVWEPSFHYLQGLLLMLGILLCLQQFQATAGKKYAWYAAILFFCSTYSLEIFYLTPLFTLLLCVYYDAIAGHDKVRLKTSLLYFLLPQIVFFGLHLAVLNAVYHSGIGHVGTATMTASSENLSKPLKYIFHILFMGRYFGDATRRSIYHLCESFKVLVVFYGFVIVMVGAIVLRYKQMGGKMKAISLLFLFAALATALLIPVWFPDTFVVIYDRYTYVTDAFGCMLLTLLISCIPVPVVALLAWGMYAMVELYFTHKVVKMWQVSGDIVNRLVYTFPNDPAKTVLVLNVPECYYGVQMIGSREEGEFRILYNAVMPVKISNPVFEVSAYNITSPGDGVHVQVVNDSTLHVTLNQWGTWWWWYGVGAGNWENTYYRLKMLDMGYELILKPPLSQYKLLYETAGQWKTVDMNKKNEDQY